MNTRTCFLASAIVAVAATSSFADGVIRDSIGAISGGRGGTNIAHSDNGEILSDNPAGMSNIQGEGLSSFGVDVLFTDLQYTDPQNATDAEDKPFPMAQFSYIRDIPDSPWTWGIGMYAPAGFSAEYDLVGPGATPAQTGQHRYKSLGTLVRLLPGLSCRVSDKLSIGGNLGVAVSHAELEGPYFLQSTGLPIVLDLQATGAALSWSVGAQYKLTERTTVGASFQNENRFKLDGNAQIKSGGFMGLGQTRYDAQLDVVWPRSAGLGVRHEWSCCDVISADVIWYDWSHAFETFDLTLTNPSDPVFQVAAPNVLDRFPLNWRDSVSVRTGYEHTYCDNKTLRMGYIYHRNPIPNGTLTPFIQATLEHTFSIGHGWECCDTRIDMAYQFSFSGTKNVGQSNFLGGDFNNATHRTQAHWFFISGLKKF